MQFSRFFCGRDDAEYTSTVSDLPLLEQGFRIASVRLSSYAILNEMQSTFVRADSNRGNSTTTVLGPLHGGYQGSMELTSLDMTPYWNPNDPNDRIVAVSTCCSWRWASYDSTAELVLLKTEGGSRIEPQPGWNNW